MPAIVRPGLFLASLLVSVFVSLSGCIDSGGIAPQAELADDPDLLTDQAIAKAAQAADWPRAQWWQAYGDAQLNAWVERALAGSPSLAMAAARVRRAQALAGVAAAAQAPQVGLDASVQRKRWPDDNFYGPGPLARTTSWNNTAAFGLSYDLDLWGRLRSQREQALSQARVAATEARAAALELQGSVVRAYIQLARQYAELDITKAELKQREELLALAVERRRIGLGTELEVSTAEAPLPEAHRQLDLAHEAIALTRNQLAALVGEGPGAAAAAPAPAAGAARRAAPAQPPAAGAARPASGRGRRALAGGGGGARHRGGQGRLLSQHRPARQPRFGGDPGRRAGLPALRQADLRPRPGAEPADLRRRRAAQPARRRDGRLRPGGRAVQADSGTGAAGRIRPADPPAFADTSRRASSPAHGPPPSGATCWRRKPTNAA